MTTSEDKERLIKQFVAAGFSQKLIEAFKQVKREEFIPASLHEQAYDDTPLPIGHGQTISQPTTVMMMLGFLEVEKQHRVLEIGSGSGYNAALLSLLAKEVYSTEQSPALLELARRTTQQYRNVHILQANGWGCNDKAHYHRIIATCALKRIPAALLEQLGPDGILLAPVNAPYGGQIMTKIKKTEHGLIEEHLGSFVFVPYIEK